MEYRDTPSSTSRRPRGLTNLLRGIVEYIYYILPFSLQYGGISDTLAFTVMQEAKGRFGMTDKYAAHHFRGKYSTPSLMYVRIYTYVYRQ